MFLLSYTDKLIDSIQSTTSDQLLGGLQFSSVDSIINDSIEPSSPTTNTDSPDIVSANNTSESSNIVSAISTSDSPNIGSSNSTTVTTDGEVEQHTISTNNTNVPLDVAPQCHCTSSNYITFLATIPGCLFIGGVTTMVVKVLIKKSRLRIGGAPRRTSRRPIVRDFGSLQMTCVVNETNVEGIEMQER